MATRSVNVAHIIKDFDGENDVFKIYDMNADGKPFVKATVPYTVREAILTVTKHPRRNSQIPGYEGNDPNGNEALDLKEASLRGGIAVKVAFQDNPELEDFEINKIKELLPSGVSTFALVQCVAILDGKDGLPEMKESVK
jgi:hypothetical protein